MLATTILTTVYYFLGFKNKMERFLFYLKPLILLNTTNVLLISTFHYYLVIHGSQLQKKISPQRKMIQDHISYLLGEGSISEAADKSVCPCRDTYKYWAYSLSAPSLSTPPCLPHGVIISLFGIKSESCYYFAIKICLTLQYYLHCLQDLFCYDFFFLYGFIFLTSCSLHF